MPQPEIFVIAGPNGAGKSTCAATLLPKHFPTNAFINADEIAKKLATTSPIVAGRIMLQQVHELRLRLETFAFETTLAGKSYASFLQDAKRASYLIHVAYVWLNSVELAMKRVAVRVQRGGHDIPAADIERRYRRGLRNFFELYRDLADTWVLCDNSDRMLVVVARGCHGTEPVIYDQRRYQRICHAAGTT